MLVKESNNSKYIYRYIFFFPNFLLPSCHNHRHAVTTLLKIGMYSWDNITFYKILIYLDASVHLHL